MEDVTRLEEVLENAKRNMPLELQNAAIWLLSNIEIVEELLKDSYLTEESCQNCLEQTRSKREYGLWALLAYPKIRQKYSGSLSE